MFLRLIKSKILADFNIFIIYYILIILTWAIKDY